MNFFVSGEDEGGAFCRRRLTFCGAFNLLDYPRGNARRHAVCGNVLGDDGACGDYGVITHGYARENSCVRAHPHVFAELYRRGKHSAPLLGVEVVV